MTMTRRAQTRSSTWVARHWKALEGVIRRGKACEGVRCGEIAPGWRGLFPTRDDRDGDSEMRWQRVGKARWCFRGTVRMGAFEGCASEAL